MDDLEIGDCVDAPDGMPRDGETVAVLDVNVVPCDGTHDSEVYAIVQGPSDPDDDVGDLAYHECVTEFEGAIGEPYDQSFLDLAIKPASPAGSTDRSVRCVALHPWGRKLEAAVLGSASRPANWPAVSADDAHRQIVTRLFEEGELVHEPSLLNTPNDALFRASMHCADPTILSTVIECVMDGPEAAFPTVWDHRMTQEQQQLASRLAQRCMTTD